MLERHYTLDLVRGLAALGIATYHWSAQFEVQSLGTFGVYLFFVLSALTMAMVYCPTFGASLTIENLTSFYRNRIARLMPLLLTVAMASLCLAVYKGQGSSIVAARAVFTGSGLFALGLPGLLSNATGAWSLGIEIVFYAVFPLLALALQRVSIVALLGITVGLIAAQQAFLWIIRPVSDVALLFWNYYTAPVTFAPFFAIGFLIYRIGGERSAIYLIPTTLCLTAIATFSLVWGGDLFRSALPYTALVLVAGFTIYCANRTDLPSQLRHPAEFLGNVSYALYLTHPFTRLVANKVSSVFGLPRALAFPLFLCMALSVAYLTFILFEKPMRDALRNPSSNKSKIKYLPSE